MSWIDVLIPLCLFGQILQQIVCWIEARVFWWSLKRAAVVLWGAGGRFVTALWTFQLVSGDNTLIYFLQNHPWRCHILECFPLKRPQQLETSSLGFFSLWPRFLASFDLFFDFVLPAFYLIFLIKKMFILSFIHLWRHSTKRNAQKNSNPMFWLAVP